MTLDQHEPFANAPRKQTWDELAQKQSRFTAEREFYPLSVIEQLAEDLKYGRRTLTPSQRREIEACIERVLGR